MEVHIDITNVSDLSVTVSCYVGRNDSGSTAHVVVPLEVTQKP